MMATLQEQQLMHQRQQMASAAEASQFRSQASDEMNTIRTNETTVMNALRSELAEHRTQEHNASEVLRNEIKMNQQRFETDADANHTACT